MIEPIPITFEDIDATNALFFADRASVVAKNAVTSQGIEKVSRVPEAVARVTSVFDIEVKQGERTNQKHSGRCWLFAALNVLRAHAIKNLNLDNFEFSQAYLLFYDKLEKTNWFLWNIIDTLDEPLDGRLMSFLLADPVSDGGQWDMFKALVTKYGAVPKEAMPETACSESTRDLNCYLSRYLRFCAMKLRMAHGDGANGSRLDEMRREMLSNAQRLLTTCLGCPPQEFEVRLKDKDQKLVLAGRFTPKGFLKRIIELNLDDYVSIVTAPTSDKPFNNVYTVSRLGNVVEAHGVRYLNLVPTELKRLAIAQLKDGLPVWFGCDVAQSFLDDDGVLGVDTMDIDGLFGFPIISEFNKADRLNYRESAMTHAMVFVGVNLDASGGSSLWKVENSWGKEHGKNGFDFMSDTWFDEYVYQIVVDKKYLTPEQRAVFEMGAVIELAPWDPLGALA